MNPRELFKYISSQEKIESTKHTQNKVLGINATADVLIYLEGEKFPLKGLPVAEALVAVGILKKVILEAVKFPLLFLRLTKILKSFNEIGWYTMKGFILKEKHQSVFCKEFQLLTLNFFKELKIPVEVAERSAELIAHIFAYDAAYRFIVQDIFTSIHKIDFIVTPRQTMKGAVDMVLERDFHIQLTGRPNIGVKFKRLGLLLSYLLIIPKVKRAFTKAIEKSHYPSLQFDEGDTYWVMKRHDYNFFGLTYEERVKKVV